MVPEFLEKPGHNFWNSHPGSLSPRVPLSTPLLSKPRSSGKDRGEKSRKGHRAAGLPLPFFRVPGWKITREDRRAAFQTKRILVAAGPIQLDIGQTVRPLSVRRTRILVAHIRDRRAIKSSGALPEHILSLYAFRLFCPRECSGYFLWKPRHRCRGHFLGWCRRDINSAPRTGEVLGHRCLSWF